jgi:hypothetical protein
MLHLRQTDRRPLGGIRPKNKNRRKRQRHLRQPRHQTILLQTNDTFQCRNHRRNLALLRRGRKKKRSPQPVLNSSTFSIRTFLCKGIAVNYCKENPVFCGFSAIYKINSLLRLSCVDLNSYMPKIGFRCFILAGFPSSWKSRLLPICRLGFLRHR